MAAESESSKDLRYLNRAIFNTLAADSTLVGLLGHSTSDYRIIAGTPDQMSKYPCIIYWDENTSNVFPDIDEYHQTNVNIAIAVARGQSKTYGGETVADRVYCDKIASRVVWIFQPGGQDSKDISDTLIQTHSITVTERLRIRLEEDIDVWRTDVGLLINWYFKS